MAAQSDALLSTVFAMAAEWHVADFNAQDLTNTAWAFARVAMVGQSDTLLFLPLGRAAEERLDDFGPQALAITV